MAVACLTDRAVIRVSGDERVAFLNGLISQDVSKVTPEQPQYGWLLTPQGKYFSDFIMVEDGDALLLDMPASRKDVTFTRLRMFVLRAKVVLEDVSADYHVYAAWDGGVLNNGFVDPRVADLGQRVITHEALDSDATLDDYHTHRILCGVPDVSNMDIERTAMLEANMEMLHGVDWNKGCYMGQELTARTHYRGLIKKRLLPFRFEGDAPDYDTPLMLSDESIGHVRGVVHGVGMALVKMEFAADAWAQDCSVNGQTARVLKPDWFKG
jgi:folate-binding protein YgfZ